MDLATLAEVEFGDLDSLEALLDFNALKHESIFTALLSSGEIIRHVPLNAEVRSPESFSAFLLDHDQEHRLIAARVGVAAPGDLSQLDLNNREQFEQWMQDHDQHHALIASVLGL